MASKAVVADTAPDIVGQIILLRPDQIDASDRLRPIDPVWAEALAGIMKAEGQRTPIEVCRLPGRSDYRLVTGGHRHAAATINGAYLRAEVVTNDAVERRLREVSENLHRRDLAPMDRAAFLAELVSALKVRAGLDAEQDGRAASVNARWQKVLQNEADDTNDTMSFVYGWSSEVADQLGFSKRTIERDLLLHRRLSPTIVEALRRNDHPVLRNAAQLRALAKLEEADQRHVLGLLLHANGKLSGAPFSTVTAALAAREGKKKPAPDAKRLNSFIGTYGRMTLPEKKGALAQLAGMLPAGWSLGDASAQPDEGHAARLQAALDVAFGVIAALCQGDPVDDDQLEAARAQAQNALLASRGCDLGERA